MEATAKGGFGVQSYFEKSITDKFSKANVSPLVLGGKHLVLAIFAMIGT